MATVHSAKPPLRSIALDELYTLPDPVWLIEHWAMRQTITMLTGESESFKTFVAMDLAMRAATPRFTHIGPARGSRLVGFIDRSSAATRDGGLKVVYVIGESQGAAKFRFKAWEQYHGIPLGTTGNLRVYPNRVDLFLEPERVQEFIEFEDPDIVIFDTWSRNTYGMDENNKQDVDKALKLAHELKMGGARGGRSVTFIHHPNKSGGSYRGHTALLNDTDIMIETERYDKTKENPVAPFYTKIKSMRQKETDDFIPYWARLDTQPIRDSSGTIVYKASGEPVTSLVITSVDEQPVTPTGAVVAPGNKRDMVIAYLKLNPGAKPKDIQEALWGERNGKHIYGLLKDPEITGNSKDGFYVIEPVKDTLEDL